MGEIALTEPPALIKGLQQAHAMMRQNSAAPIGKLESLRPDAAPSNRYQRNLARVAFLAPDIQAMILEGRQPPGLNLKTIMSRRLPAAWEDQRRLFEVVR